MTDWKFDIRNITGINLDGPQRFEWIDDDRYLEQRRRWAGEYGVSLPHYQALKGFGDLTDLRVLCRRLSINVKFKDTSWLDFSFFPGFITDLASVPKWFRGCIDNDTSTIIPAVLIHDYLFSTHDLPLNYTNELFYQMLLTAGYPRFKARIAKWAISSIFGKLAWVKNGNRRALWTRKTASMLLPRPIEINGIEYKGSYRNGQ